MTAADVVAGPSGAPAGEVLMDVDDLSTHFHVGGGLLGGGDAVVRAVDNVSFDVRRGEIFGLVGESGSGKTTLGRTVLGLVRATSGHVRYRGHDLAALDEKQLRPLRRNLGMIFQDPNASLNPAMTIAQGVGHPLRIHGITSSRAETRARVAEMLERCGLSPAGSFLDRYPEDMSGGQKQRVVIARALITEPEFVVADEPVAALDMSVRAKILELMMQLKDDLGLTYLYITHDLASGRFVCDRIAIMYLGQMVEWGDSTAIYDAPQHPYTRSLLNAIPLPDPTRRDRDKELPRGEIPDALAPPLGCRFHPRCPAAFADCGWEGRDLVDALEDRWTRVDEDTFERELALVGDLSKATTTPQEARFPAAADASALRSWLDEVGPQLPTPVFDGVESVEQDAGAVVVRFRFGPEPARQDVAGRVVACHLHGVTVREDGDHAGRPPTGRDA
jgi:oligopeptide/dipeptide ABC transporter ATP-binding protein